MNLQQLKYVWAISEERSFIGAANRCKVTQPTLSHSLAQFEAELGHKLFERTTRSVRLTQFGLSVLPTIHEILSVVKKLQNQAESHSVNSGMQLHVGLSPIIGLRRAAEMLDGFIGNSLATVVYHEDDLVGLCELLKVHALDIVIAPIDAEAIDRTKFSCARLQRERLFFIPRKDVAAKWAARREVSLSEIGALEFIMVADTCGLARTTRQLFDDRRIALHRYPGEASSYRVVQEWSSLGLGSGLLPESKCRFAEAGDVAIPVVENGKPLTIDYFAFGRPSTVASELFDLAWQCLTNGCPGHDGS